MHSRKCDTRTYGVQGHLWLRDEPTRQNAVWHAINSTVASGNSLDPLAWKDGSDKTSVVIRSSSNGVQHAALVVQMIRSWFQSDRLHIEELVDDSSDWNFEIMVNGVLLHSRRTQGHGFFHDDTESYAECCQQYLVRRAISDLLPESRNMAVIAARSMAAVSR